MIVDEPRTGEHTFDGLEAAGITWADGDKEERLLNAREEGAAGLRELLARDPRITAVLCATDSSRSA